MVLTVIDNLEFDCILGMDYYNTKEAIFSRERKLEFPGNAGKCKKFQLRSIMI